MRSARDSSRNGHFFLSASSSDTGGNVLPKRLVISRHLNDAPDEIWNTEPIPIFDMIARGENALQGIEQIRFAAS